MSAQNPKPAKCPLPIATLQLSRALLVLHARLRGELAKARDDEELLVDDATATEALGHIEGLFKFLGIEFVEKDLKPIRTRPKIGPLSFGDLRVEILAALRAATDWLSYRDIADYIIEKHHLELTASRHAHFLQKLREATHALSVQRAVEREHSLKLGSTTTLQRWRLSGIFRQR